MFWELCSLKKDFKGFIFYLYVRFIPVLVRAETAKSLKLGDLLLTVVKAKIKEQADWASAKGLLLSPGAFYVSSSVRRNKPTFSGLLHGGAYLI